MLTGWSSLCFTFFALVSTAICDEYVKRFEFKYSFKGPHLVQKDGTIPFWEHGGHAIASEDSIRITPSLRSKQGYVWGTNQVTFRNWEVQVTFRVSGRGRLGADGLAIWYTAQRNTPGPVFGNQDFWNGLGVIFDSFDNDGQGNNPYVMAMVNNGQLSYDHKTDGVSQQLGGCLRDFRNKPFPLKVRIVYKEKVLQVWFHNGMSAEPAYELCAQASQVELPENGYFGVSAATGGLADDHDVNSFLTYSLTSASKPDDKFTDEERLRFEKEFEEYQRKLDEAQEEFRRQHPEAARKKPYDEDIESNYESVREQELRQIYQVQRTIMQALDELKTKVDVLGGKHDIMLNAVRTGGGGTGGGGGSKQQQQQLPAATSAVQRQDVDQLIANQRQLSNSVSEIRTLITDVQQRTSELSRQPRSAGGGGGGGAAFPDKVAHEVRDRVNGMQDDLQRLVRISQESSKTVDCQCLGQFGFVALIFLQMVLVIGYFAYRERREAAAKKFY